MLDGLLGRGFSSKSKSLIKLIKARIDIIRRKRNSVQKFLKKDIADLLKNGLDINAYGRAGGLIVELDLSYCYDAVEQFCGLVSSHLSVMQSQSECPEECKEAVSSLMFAAARFADLPELRDLRHIFTEKYGNSLEAFVSKEFVKKLASNPPVVDTKLQLMQDIAKEYSIKWDRKAFEQMISSAPASVQDQPRRQRSNEPGNDVCKPRTGHDNTSLKREEIQDISSVRIQEPAANSHKPQDGRREISLKRDKREIAYQGRQQLSDDSYKHNISREETVLDRDKQDIAGHGRRELANGVHGRQELTNGVYKALGGRKETILRRDNQDISPHGRWGYTDDDLKLSNGRGNGTQKRNDHQQKSFHDGSEQEKGRVEAIHKRGNQEASTHGGGEFIISGHGRKHTVKTDRKDPPYSTSSRHKKPSNSETEKVPAETESIKPQYHNFIPPPYVKPNVGKYGTHHAASHPDKSPVDRPNHNGDFTNDRSESSQSVLEYRINGHGDQTTQYSQDELVDDTKPKPRSVRRRHKLPPGHEQTSNAGLDEIEKRHRRTRRREDVKRHGLQHALDDECVPTDEEKMMDRLLMHYSKKPSKYEEVRLRNGLKAPPPSHDNAAEGGESHLSQQSVDGARSNSGPPTRLRSLPADPVTPTEAARLPTRATSFQPDMLNQAGHVHPKLPDYDDLAARFTALRGR